MRNKHSQRKDYSRNVRVADLLKRELAQIIQFKLQDPRLSLVSITEVKVNKNLAFADVYINDLNQLTNKQAKIEQTIETLNHAMSLICQHLSSATSLRYLPRLRFHYDHSVVNGQHLSGLIDQARKQDNQVHSPDKK